MKERKKKFDKQTAKFCASQERYLGLSTKKTGAVLQEVRLAVSLNPSRWTRCSTLLIKEVGYLFHLYHQGGGTHCSTLLIKEVKLFHFTLNGGETHLSVSLIKEVGHNVALYSSRR